MQDRLFIRFLTGDDLLVDAPVAIEWKGRATRALFALLALHPGEPVSRDRLAGLLWAESDQQAARGSLRMALLGLRRVFDPIDPDLIQATNDSIMLNVEREAIDWALFETLCARPDVTSRLEALDLYRGNLSATFPTPHEAANEILRDERGRLRELAIKTSLELIAEFDDHGDPGRVGAIARKVLMIEPANEPAHRAMMRIHAAASDRSAVLRQYEQCCKALDEHYDVVPSTETTALKNQIVEVEAAGAAEPAVQSVISEWEAPAPPAPPPDQRKRSRRRKFLPAIIALAVIGMVALAFWPCALSLSCGEASPPPVISLSLGFTEAGGVAAEVTDEIRNTLEETLGRISGAIVITRATATDALPDLPGNNFIVDAVVDQRGDRLRVYVDLRDGGPKPNPDKFQYKIDTHTIARLVAQLEADLIPALQSRIGRDTPDE